MSDVEVEPVEPDEGGAEAEEDEAEAVEEEESAPQAEPEPEPEDDADRLLSEQKREKAYAAVERSWKTYTAAIERNLGDETKDWLGCPMCAANMIPGHVHRDQLGAFPDEVAANVKYALGLAREQEYEQARNLDTCGDCRGLGKVKTGSQVGNYMTITCPRCKGHGYFPPPGAASSGNGTATVSVPAEVAISFDHTDPDRDAWGEPRVLPDGTLNDNFGKMPQFKQPHPVYGITANLTSADVLSA